MIKNKRGMSAWIWIIIILIIIAVGIGAYFLLMNNSGNLCTDTDGGADYNNKGTACLNGECVSDYCETSNNLREYACDNRNPEQGDIDYKSYSCPNGCENGACIR